MEKIKCPHCGAMNQDVKMSDLCWQCDFALDSPKVEEVDVTKPEMHTPANSGASPMELQKSTPPHQVLPTPPTTAARKIPAIAIIAVLVILLLIALFLFRPK